MKETLDLIQYEYKPYSDKAARWLDTARRKLKLAKQDLKGGNKEYTFKIALEGGNLDNGKAKQLFEESKYFFPDDLPILVYYLSFYNSRNAFPLKSLSAEVENEPPGILEVIKEYLNQADAIADIEKMFLSDVVDKYNVPKKNSLNKNAARRVSPSEFASWIQAFDPDTYINKRKWVSMIVSSPIALDSEEIIKDRKLKLENERRIFGEGNSARNGRPVLKPFDFNELLGNHTEYRYSQVEQKRKVAAFYDDELIKLINSWAQDHFPIDIKSYKTSSKETRNTFNSIVGIREQLVNEVTLFEKHSQTVYDTKISDLSSDELEILFLESVKNIRRSRVSKSASKMLDTFLDSVKAPIVQR